MSKEKIKKISQYVIRSLPLVGVVAANMMNISAREHQFLILITLLWMQTFLFLEIFSKGSQ